MQPFSRTLTGIAVGALIGAAGVWLAIGGNPKEGSAQTSEPKPLYWVAPMDPNYKRDKPGKSPMGMDLIPVYEDEGTNKEVGAVTISPDVVNNLGVRTTTVTQGSLAVTVNTVGYVQYDEDRLLHVHPRVEGWIEKLHVKAAGDQVSEGEPLYELYSPTLVNAQEELLLALKRKNPVLIQASIERLSSLQVSKAQINRLKRTGKVTQTVTVKAPQSGIVDNLDVREGMFVKPGQNIMTIGQLEHIWVIGEVFERQAASVQEGNSVRMWLDYLPGRLWEGTVDYIYPSLNTKTRTAGIRVHFHNPDGYLKPGMFAQMSIATPPSKASQIVPREALIRTGNQARVVLALGDGRFKSIGVEVGQVTENQAEILSGLNHGDRIVTSAHFLLDSESSKTSDFQRMAHGEMETDQHAKPETVWVTARVENTMQDHQMVTLEHEAIESWQWPSMVMDFGVDKAVDLAALQPGLRVHVEIQRLGNDNYQISQIHIPDNGSANEATNNDSEMDHSQHAEPRNNDGNPGSHTEEPLQGMDHSQHIQENKP